MMNSEQHSDYLMFTAVRAILKINSKIVRTNEALNNCLLHLDELISAIDTTTEIKNKEPTNQSEPAREDLIKILYKVIKALFSFATNQKDYELKGRYNVNIFQLRQLKKNELINKAANILNIARANFAHLKKYNIKENTLTLLSESIEDYRKTFDSDLSSLTQADQSQKDVDTLINETCSYLKTVVDDTVETVKYEHPRFYDEYMNARLIKLLGIKQKQL